MFVSVTLVYCGKTPKRIELALVMRMTIENSYCVLDGDSDPFTEKDISQ